MEENKEMNVPIILIDMIEQEKENFDKFELGTDEHKMAVNNVKTLVDAFTEIEKVYCDNDHVMCQLEQDKDLKERQLELDADKVSVDIKSAELERQRLEMDRESREKETRLKELQAYGEIAVGAGTIAVSLIGLACGCALTNKTLDVNLESVISDRDAVQSANRIFDRFLRK